jgi:hypothetical protein
MKMPRRAWSPHSIRADPELKARVIVLTATSRTSTRTHGADYYLTKPFSPRTSGRGFGNPDSGVPSW